MVVATSRIAKSSFSPYIFVIMSLIHTQQSSEGNDSGRDSVHCK